MDLEGQKLPKIIKNYKEQLGQQLKTIKDNSMIFEQLITNY
jgi:hypothetical protein